MAQPTGTLPDIVASRTTPPRSGGVTRWFWAGVVLPFVLLVGAGLLGCRPAPPPTIQAPTERRLREVRNLEAFARLYGYVRYFHPSDEAAALDWDRFALYAAPRVRRARNTEELRVILEQLFRPVAPDVRVYRDGESLRRSETSSMSEHVDNRVAWQHVGVDLEAAGTPYRSLRLNRGGYDVLRRSTSGFRASIDARALRGREIRLTASGRGSVRGLWRNRGHLWLEVRKVDGGVGFHNATPKSPIMAGEWRTFLIEGRVDDDATDISFGGKLIGTGRLWMDDFQLFARNPEQVWRRVPFPNGGFEQQGDGSFPLAWEPYPEGSAVQRVAERPFEGRSSLLVENHRVPLEGPLFDEHPLPGEFIDELLTNGLRCRVPLTLDSARVARSSVSEVRRLEELLERIDVARLTAENVDVRTANIVIAWNVLQHFFPYFDVTGLDWRGELPKALGEALVESNEEEFHAILQRLVAKLEDGHAHAFWLDGSTTAYPPFVVDWVEDQVVVTASSHAEIKPGDVILRIDGVDAKSEVVRREQLVSGSPQWKRRWVLMYEIGTGDPGSTVEVELEGREGRKTVHVVRRTERQVAEPRPEKISELAPGVAYVDLTAATMDEIREHFEDLSIAKGIIFDVRGYPMGNHRILEHLITEPDSSSAWLRVPRTIYPDRRGPAQFEDHGWNLKPAEPHLAAHVVFLTDSRAISYAEGLLSFVPYYDLGDIVGSPTAGANGNINTLYLAGGYQVVFGGMVVVNHDGSQFHNIGILPTYPTYRTVRGIRLGKDELIDEALNILSRELE